MTKYLTVEDLDPGFLARLEAKGVLLSNNAGAIIVEGYLGDLLDAVAEHVSDDPMGDFQGDAAPEEED